MKSQFALLLVISTMMLLVGMTMADVYMHNPRGSNDRNCERQGGRQNANRLFDSQNNGNGGYPCPRPEGSQQEVEVELSGNNPLKYRMYYYEGSILPVMWTAQHACGGDTTQCQIVLQYACEDTMPGARDGTPTAHDNPTGENTSTATATIPDDPDTSKLELYGQHETYDYYQKCKARHRNQGLWAATKTGITQQGTRATQTRQENNGRYGFECPEERDYYPYWHPTPWKDIAVFTTNTSNCLYYQQNSENVLGRGECMKNAGDALNAVAAPENNPGSCGTQANQQWVVRPSHNLDKPECLSATLVASRENHLGNAGPAGFGDEMATYLWTIPKLPDNVEGYKSCVLRIRYNITNNEVLFNETDASFNGAASKVTADTVVNTGAGFPLEMAIDIEQTGRTFQDRSYVFQIKKRPTKVELSNKATVDVPSWARIYNINVRGKRGNIVQVYPSVEYDFAPNKLSCQGGEFVHFQWTGSDYNPDRDGEGGPAHRGANDPFDSRANNGPAGSDRSNVVQTLTLGHLTPVNSSASSFFKIPPYGDVDTVFANKIAMLDQDMSICQSTKQLTTQTPNNNNADNARRDMRNCAKLSASRHPYADFGLFPCSANGRFHLMSSRNNNFSNRRQTLQIDVTGAAFSGASSLAGGMMAIVVSIVAMVLLAL